MKVMAQLYCSRICKWLWVMQVQRRPDILRQSDNFFCLFFRGMVNQLSFDSLKKKLKTNKI